MQNSSFLCGFVCSILIDYQYINPYKQVSHTKHNDFCVKFIYSVRTRKVHLSLYTPPPSPLKNKNVCKKYVSMQNPLFVCVFLCSVSLDYQCINPYKQVLHTKHNYFEQKFIYSVRTHTRTIRKRKKRFLQFRPQLGFGQCRLLFA